MFGDIIRVEQFSCIKKRGGRSAKQYTWSDSKQVDSGCIRVKVLITESERYHDPCRAPDGCYSNTTPNYVVCRLSKSMVMGGKVRC